MPCQLCQYYIILTGICSAMAISISCLVLVLIPSQKAISALALSTILMFDIPATLRPNLSHSAKLDSTRIFNSAG